MSDKVAQTYDLSTISYGVNYLKDGYIDYAQEVISGRALPDIYDGLKPVNRRILATLYNSKTKNFMKSERIAGNVLALHPHGDTSVYQAMVLMTQLNGSLAFPLIEGAGNFGGVYKDDKPAAARYTEARLHTNTEEYFNEMNGIDMIPNFDATMNEPSVLPVSFPAVLVNSTSGIAVGFRSNIPSFNFNDVLDLVVEYIDNGKCTTVIEPDFVTGGYYVRNQKELLKLMQAGKCKIKLRSKMIEDGKKLLVTEIPFGRTIQKLMKQINNLNANSIRNAYDTDDFDQVSLFTIECSSKNRLQEANYVVIKDTDMQYTYNADITVVKNGVPMRLGVWGIIEEWVKWRRGVLTKEFTYQYNSLKESFREASAFMNIVNNYEKRMELVRLIADSGRDSGRKFIRENFTREEVPEDLIDFCAGRSLPSYHDGGRYASIFANATEQLEKLQNDIDNVDNVIKTQMQRLKAKYGATMKRRTEVTTKDYEFAESEDTTEKILDTSYCYYEFKDGFLKKLRTATGNTNNEYQFEGTASDTLVAFDNRGRLLRVYCQDLPMTGSEIGTYLPTYFGLQESDDYKITYIGRMTGKELMLLYKDGNVGFVDTSEWIGNNRNVRILQKGISTTSAPYLGAVLEDIPQMIYVSDEDGNIAWEQTSEIKHKARTATTRVFNLRHNKLLDSYLPIDMNLGMLLVNNYVEYHGKLKELKDIEDFRGDVNDFIDMM